MLKNLPGQLKVASVTLAVITPATIGTSVSRTGGGGTVPRKMALNMTEKKGSAACMSNCRRLLSSSCTCSCPAGSHGQGLVSKP